MPGFFAAGKPPIILMVFDIERKADSVYGKFTFYSAARLYALTLDASVVIMLGPDSLYWVVDRKMARMYSDQGCRLFCDMPKYIETGSVGSN